MGLQVGKKQSEKLKKHLRRKVRIRKRISGSETRLRLTVFRSLNHIYAQVIDDEKGLTLACANSAEKSLASAVSGLKKVEVAGVVGKCLAERVKDKGISTAIVFDRNGRMYHGRVKALAESAREHGLVF